MNLKKSVKMDLDSFEWRYVCFFMNLENKVSEFKYEN